MGIMTGWKIWIDAGHGGTPTSTECDQRGAAGNLSGAEKDINLAVALELKALLKGDGAVVLMTRETDTVVCLDDRCRMANDAGANLFISIHHNSHSDPSVNGTETHWYKPQDRALADYIHARLISRLRRTDRGVRQSDFRVLTKTKMAAALTEAVYLSNPSDDQFIAQASNKALEARAIYEGIRDYILAICGSPE